MDLTSSSSATSRPWPRWAWAVLWLAPPLVAGVMIALTAGTWFDPIVDTGQDFYTAWRLAEGDALGRDLAYIHGPFSPHLIALWMACFGVSIRSVVCLNLLLAAALAAVMALVLRRVGGPLAAWAGAMLFALVYLVGDYALLSGYNYLTPYKQPITHGLLLAWVALGLSLCYAGQGRRRWLLGAGLAAGLAFLTKTECFLAATVPLAAIVALNVRRRGWAATRLDVLVGFAAILLPPLVAWVLLGLRSDPATAWAAMLGEWRFLGVGGEGKARFYQQLMGLDHPLHRLGLMAMWSVPYVLALGVAWAAAGWRSRGAWLRRAAAVGGVVLIFVAATRVVGLAPTLRDLVAPWPALVWLLVLVTLASAVRLPRDADAAAFARAAGRLGLALLAALMLLKMGLKARISDYGFALTMPAAMLLLTAGLAWLPPWLQRRGRDPLTVALAAAAALLAFALPLAPLTVKRAQAKSNEVAHGGDRFLADARGIYVQKTLDLLATLPADQTLAVLPDGVSINYLSRRVNPTGYLNFVPNEVSLFGEDVILQRFQAHPPDHLLIVEVDTSEYGAAVFGRDYAQLLWTWIRRHYQPRGVLGEEPLQGRGFGVMLVTRKDLAR